MRSLRTRNCYIRNRLDVHVKVRLTQTRKILRNMLCSEISLQFWTKCQGLGLERTKKGLERDRTNINFQASCSLLEEASSSQAANTARDSEAYSAEAEQKEFGAVAQGLELAEQQRDAEDKRLASALKEFCD